MQKIVTSFYYSSQLNDLLEESQLESGIEKKHVLHLTYKRFLIDLLSQLISFGNNNCVNGQLFNY